MVYTVPVIIFMDDASANISKQWNKQIVVYLSNAGLPREMLDKEFCMRFVTSSPNASPMELMHAVRDSMEALDSPVITYDCKTGEEIMTIPYVIFTTSDNLMHAEQTSHCGLNSNYFCRTCHVGGTKAYKKTNKARSSGIKDATVVPILNLITTKGKTLHSKKILFDVNTSDDTWFNIHLDTPTEILHTVLLGVIKYYWVQTMWYLKSCSKSLSLFQTRLASVHWNSLNATSTNAEYICQYHNSLIGKHFKSLVQVMPFLIFDLVPQDVLHAWNIIGALVVLLWHTKIEDMERYLCTPSILVTKPKFHFLVHLPAFIHRFGPAIIFSTECYESFNHVFHLSCIYSNRQAPTQDRIKHITTGGFWFDASTRSWTHAGQIVLNFVSTRENYMTWLGLPKGSKSKPGAHLS
ncbi:hypothetical protein EI94DRAFT_1774419 [Lactarius quietus]|nr:hypothetical protein EI94DRAFT_1774419 [Lactarius quietus]